MNWRSTGITLLITGLAVAIGGAVWRNQLHGDAYECRIKNLIRLQNDWGGRVDCPTTMLGNVVVVVGVALALLAVALLAGTVKPSAPKAPDATYQGGAW